MNELVSEYGYYSTGESFSIADKDEVWIMDFIGKGNKEKGAVWVARKIPDGYVSGHANQARITTFPSKKEKNSISSDQMKKLYDPNVDCIYASDVISFAKEMGLYKGEDKNFSFSDTYAPVDFGAARFCEIRVWTMFNKVSGEMEENWDYVKGNIEHADVFKDGTPNPNHYVTNRMPLWVKVDKKVSVADMMGFMRDHLEGTELDMANDIGAGPFATPYRWRPLTWEVDGVAYCNERATATQQTGFSFITQSRSWLPNELGGILWWGVDDASGTVYMPMFTSITSIPSNFAVGNGAMMEWSETSGFWIFNQVQNFTYTRYNIIHPDVEAMQSQLETSFIESISMIDKEAIALYENEPSKAVGYLTEISDAAAIETFNTWKDLYAYLFVKYIDGNVKVAKEIPEGYKYVAPDLKQPGYSPEKYKLIIEQTGDRFKVIGEAH
jgi:dipeptidase